MFIGIDASRAARHVRTGTENYAYQLIRQLLALDTAHQYRLYLRQPPPAGLFDARAETRVIGVPRLWTHLGLGLEMMRRAPDVLFVPAHVLPVVHPRRSVVTIHDLGYRYFPDAHTATQRAYLEWSTGYAVRHASRIVAVSHATKDDLVRWHNADERKIAVVHHGICAPSPQAGAQSSDVGRWTRNAKRYLVAIGTIQPRKNYARLIEAFVSLDLPRDELALVIIGKEGWNCGEIIARAQQAGVVLTGHVGDETRDALLRVATAFVLPSLYEGFGMPILEAQAMGVPVITGNTSSCPEVAGDGALLVNPLDTSAIAHAIRQVLDDGGLRESLIRRGFSNVKKFSWETCARDTLAVIESA